MIDINPLKSLLFQGFSQIVWHAKTKIPNIGQMSPSKSHYCLSTLWWILLVLTYCKLDGSIITGKSFPQAGLLFSVRCLLFRLAVVMLIQPHHVAAPGGVRQAEVPRLREKWYLQRLPYRM